MITDRAAERYVNVFLETVSVAEEDEPGKCLQTHAHYLSHLSTAPPSSGSPTYGGT